MKQATNTGLNRFVRKFWHLLFVLVIEGATLIAVELMGARLLALFYGSSLLVWTTVLCGLCFVLSPLLFLSLVPTLLISYLKAKIDDSATTARKVFTFSLSSGILVLPIMGFFVIPNFLCFYKRN